MTGERLASELTERLASVFPSAVQILVLGDEIEVDCPDRPGRVNFRVGELLMMREREHDALEFACLTLIDQLQDFVAEVTTDPWPGLSVMPVPVVTVRDDRIEIVFEHDGKAVLTLPPIELP